MKGLLKKDHILLKDYFFLFVMLDIAISVMIGGTLLLTQPEKAVMDVSRLAIISYVLLTMVQSLVNQTFNDDEKSGFLANAFTQPVARGDYVKAKYILALQLTGVFAGIHTIGIFIGLVLRKEPLPSDAMMLLAEIFIIALAGATIISFNSISLFMKFGAGKKRDRDQTYCCCTYDNHLFDLDNEYCKRQYRIEYFSACNSNSALFWRKLTACTYEFQMG